jgi:hypothetical protein
VEIVMDVAMMQPSFLPWLGYFELALKADRFVLLDDFQFSVQSWHQRNRLFVSPGKADWVTVPVLRASFGQPLNETRIDESKPWRTKTWKRLAQSYSKAPHFATVGPLVRAWLETPAASLGEMNVAFVRMVMSLLGADTEVLMSSATGTRGERSQRVLDLLRFCEADRYLCARGSFDYMRDDCVFPVEGIEVLFQDFRVEPYPQISSPDEFVGYLSIVDALMNVGADETARLVAHGTGHWLGWDEMLACAGASHEAG